MTFPYYNVDPYSFCTFGSFMGEGDVAFTIGWLLMTSRQWAQAAVFLLESLRLRGGHVATYTNLGICWYQGGEVLGAGAWFEKALRLDSTHPKALGWRDRIVVQQGKAEESELFALRRNGERKFFFAHVPV